MGKPKVMLAVPNMGWIHKTVILALRPLFHDPRVILKDIYPTHRPYENNLHHIRKQFLEEGHDYLIIVDDDNPPMRNILDLVFLDLDIVGCPTPIWKTGPVGDRPYCYNVMIEVPGGFKPADSFQGFKPEGLQQVHAVGSGCMVLSRKVMLDIKRPFLRTYDDEGIVQMSGDFAFCKRARARGFEVYAHFDYPCRHVKELEITETVNYLTASLLR
jgi:hypothetical protein